MSSPTSAATSKKKDEAQVPLPEAGEGGLKVLFLSSDTGGGHRASAESLARQFQLLYPGSTYELLDVVEKDGTPPYNSLVSYYKHLSARPTQWKLVYNVSNSRAFEMLADAHLKLMCERAVRKRIMSYDPDVVVSVHPLMTNVPVLSCKKISKETGRHLPIFTVVTDLGSAHCLWFANGVEKMFVGSDAVWELAKQRGKVPEEKLIKYGLPIRHAFAEQAELLGDRYSEEGKAYILKTREELELSCTDRTTVLVMGGGEGVGSLSNIVNALYFELKSQGISALILVVCGRNEALKKSLDERDWDAMEKKWVASNKSKYSLGDCGVVGSADAAGCIQTVGVGSSIRRILSASSVRAIMPLPDSDQICVQNEIEEEKKSEVDPIATENLQVGMTLDSPLGDDEKEQIEEKTQEVEQSDEQENVELKEQDVQETVEDTILADEMQGSSVSGDVKVVGLGFVTKMAEYMVASDVLVSKAGPGTISEAAALSLPVMLTSFLPGQEEGNVDFVVDNGFGAFCSDSDPSHMAEELCMWLKDEIKMRELSAAAKACGRPHAAKDIVQVIGDSSLKWKEINRAKNEVAATGSSVDTES